MMKKKNPGSSDVVLDTKKETIARGKKGSYEKRPGGKNIVTTQTVQKGSRAATGSTIAARQGRGRIGEKTYVRMQGTGGPGGKEFKGAMVKSTVSGAKGTRTLADGTKVVKEASVSKIKKKGVSQPKAKGAKVTKRALGVKEKTASQIKAKGVTTSGKPSASTADLKKKKTAGKSPAKSYGSKKKSPMMKKGVKGLKQSPVKKTDDKNPDKKKKKLGTEGMSYKEKMAYYAKQKKAKVAKNSKISMGMGSGYTTIKK